MPSSPTTYPDWKAPREDGQILIWPEPAKLLADTTENNRRLGQSDATIQNAPLAEIRRAARTWIGHTDQTQPIIADGHQTELHHPGVWVKRALSHFAASRLSAAAAHFAIDTDAPKHLLLRWLGGSVPITDDPRLNDAHWTGMLDAPTPAHLADIGNQIGAVGVVPDFLVSLRRLALETPKLPPALTNALHELDWSLGLRHHAYLASPIWSSPSFLTFTHHIVARAGAFAADYNAALAQYRRAKKIRSNMRPMPDLAILDESVELPFWLDDLSSGDRTRPSAFAREGGGYVMSAPGGGDDLEFDPTTDAEHAAERVAAWLRRNDLRLAPRALTLTMYLRLFVVDQFIHGIGGGQYDQVTDRIIATHFQIDPPHFAVATGTMYQPQALHRTRVCVPCVVQEGHRLRHSLLGERKRELLAAIDSAPRHSPQRYAAFASMHRELNAAAAGSADLAAWERQLGETRLREAEESALFDRELFYGLQPRDRLESMAGRFAQAFANA